MSGYGAQWGAMGGYGYGGYSFGLIHMIFWVVLLIAVVVAVVWMVRSMMSGGGAAAGSHAPPPPRRSPGLDVLEERYARGEISRDEYLEKKRDMLG